MVRRVGADLVGELTQQRHHRLRRALQFERAHGNRGDRVAVHARHLCIHAADVPADHHSGVSDYPHDGRQNQPSSTAMRIIGVVDLLGGRAVQARGGERHAYQPVTSVGGVPVPEGDAVTIAHGYLTQLGVGELYVADLDAILGRAPNDGIVMTLATIGTRLWLDSGVSSIDRAERAIACGATRVVVGLETLGSFGALSEICRTVDGQRVAFSLDLKNGVPLAPLIPSDHPETLVARAADAGVR